MNLILIYCIYIYIFLAIDMLNLAIINVYDSTAQVSTILSHLQGDFVIQESSNFVEPYKHQLYVYKQAIRNV